MLAGALGDRRLPDQKRTEILIADGIRQDRKHQRAETDAHKTRSAWLAPARTWLFLTHTNTTIDVSTRLPPIGDNAVGFVMVRLTLRTR